MISKLTLSVDDEVIADAKAYANKHGISLSKMVEFYFGSLSSESRTKSSKLPPLTRSLVGLARTSHKFTDDKAELKKALVNRYS